MPKCKKTVLSIYCQERMRRENRNMSMKEAIEAFYLEFKSLPPEERSIYERMLAEHKGAQKINQESEAKLKIDPLLLNPEYDLNRYEMAVKYFHTLFKIDKTKSKNKSLASIKEESTMSTEEQIVDQRWYFIKFETFCRAESATFKEAKSYSPYFVLAEVAVLEYSLRHGIMREYAEFIEPNEIPLGYRAACMDSMNDFHKIPLIRFERVRKSYQDIYMDIIHFISEGGMTEPAALFCLESDHEQTSFCLEYLYDQTCEKKRNVVPASDIKLFDLEALFVFLADFKSTEVSYPGALDILTLSIYDYSSKSTCEYHEDIGCKECSLGVVKRAAYSLSDHLCSELYNIKLTKSHLPVSKPVGTIIESKDFCNFNYRPYASSYGGSSRSGRFSNSNYNRAQNRSEPNRNGKTASQTYLNFKADENVNTNEENRKAVPLVTYNNKSELNRGYAGASNASTVSSSCATRRMTVADRLERFSTISSNQTNVGSAHSYAGSVVADDVNASTLTEISSYKHRRDLNTLTADGFSDTVSNVSAMTMEPAPTSKHQYQQQQYQQHQKMIFTNDETEEWRDVDITNDTASSIATSFPSSHVKLSMARGRSSANN